MRDEKVDFLRFVGLAMIILAHIGPPAILHQLRNFDVPLMLMVAGMSFGLSYRGESYGAYLWQRVNRLVFPVWIFLSIYFSLLYWTGFPTALPTPETITSSYLLLSGIGYVWIIRVFLLVALVAPLIARVDRQIHSHSRYFLTTAAIYLFYELLLMATTPMIDSLAGRIFEGSVLYLLPYGLIFWIGMRLPALSRSQVAGLTLGAVAVFATLGSLLYLKLGKFIPTQDFKYSPSAYYLSYALAVSTFLWLISGRAVNAIADAKLMPPVQFVARNSIWIYLWHIPLLDAIHLKLALKYPAVFLMATLITLAQVRLVERVLLPRFDQVATRKSLRTLLTG